MSSGNPVKTRKLFGTDGIRGRAGRFPLDAPTVERLGEAVVEILPADTDAARILIGRDTRESGNVLESALCRGIIAGGGRPVLGGILPTPAVAHLTRTDSYSAGIMISASHNPFDDNGIKIFSGDGFKLTDAAELDIEYRLDKNTGNPVRSGLESIREAEEEMANRYRDHLREVANSSVPYGDLRIALDCANGASCRIAPELFRSLGAEVHSMGVRPNGRNINESCGSVHPEQLKALTVRVAADLGVAFDGDADRAVVVDPKGRILDGDHILFLSAISLKRRNLLKGNGVVSTVMANQWLEQELSKEKISLHRTAVGDRYVLEGMVSRGCNLGGEPSGHLIYLDHSSTGDGILTVLMLLEAVQELGWNLSDWLETVKKFPQKIVNVPVVHKPSLREHPEIGKSIRREEERLGDSGRVLVRYSGTEPLARIMVEAEDPNVVDEVCRNLSSSLRQHLSASPPGNPRKDSGKGET